MKDLTNPIAAKDFLLDKDINQLLLLIRDQKGKLEPPTIRQHWGTVEVLKTGINLLHNKERNLITNFYCSHFTTIDEIQKISFFLTRLKKENINFRINFSSTIAPETFTPLLSELTIKKSLATNAMVDIKNLELNKNHFRKGTICNIKKAKKLKVDFLFIN